MEHDKYAFIQYTAAIACQSLIEEAELTPKPGLVDRENTGAHHDLSIQLMRTSAEALFDTFAEIASVSFGRTPSQTVREEIAAIGRRGEQIMFEATGGINTHKGAIWAIGLLISAVSIGKGNDPIPKIISLAGQIARYPDSYCPNTKTNGRGVFEKFGVGGARTEAEQGFPHISHYSLPVLIRERLRGRIEKDAQLLALLSLIAHLNDTCILHRGGMDALIFAQQEAKAILISEDLDRVKTLDDEFIKRRISPGGSADLLAATLFLDKIQASAVFKEEKGGL